MTNAEAIAIIANGTKKSGRDAIRDMIVTNDEWAVRALLAIYGRQTAYEQSTDSTQDHNNVGFSSCDAEILSSFARQYQKNRWLSAKQMCILRRKMVKYTRQLLEISRAKLVKAM